jgi:hypothetical protein
MWHALKCPFEGIRRKLEVQVWFVVFGKKREVAI